MIKSLYSRVKSAQPRRRSQAGLSLIEVMLGLVLLSAAAVGVFKMLDGAKVNAAVNKEQAHVEQLSDLIKSFYMNSDGDFEAISTAAVASLTGVPSEMKANGGLVSAFGSPVTIAFDPARPKEFALRYQDLNPVQCLKLITSVSPVTNRISIATDTAGTAFTQVQDDPNFDSSVTAAAAGRMKTTDILAAQCGQAHFVAKSGVLLLVFSADSDPAVIFTPAPSVCVCSPRTETALNACPVGQSGATTQTRAGTCTGGTAACPSIIWGAWSTISNTCAPIVTPPGVTPPVALPGVPCIPETQTRTLACPIGQVGTITEAQTSSCAATTSVPVWSGVWTPTSTTCVTPITPPGSVCVPTTVTDPTPPVCPASQCGTITRQKTMVCDASNNLVAPIPDVWSVVSNTCVDAVVAGCAAPPSSCSTSDVTATTPQATLDSFLAPATASCLASLPLCSSINTAGYIGFCRVSGSQVNYCSGGGCLSSDIDFACFGSGGAIQTGGFSSCTSVSNGGVRWSYSSDPGSYDCGQNGNFFDCQWVPGPGSVWLVEQCTCPGVNLCPQGKTASYTWSMPYPSLAVSQESMCTSPASISGAGVPDMTPSNCTESSVGDVSVGSYGCVGETAGGTQESICERSCV